MKKSLMSGVSLLALASLLGACGKARELPEYMVSEFNWPADGSNIDGVYLADFITLNTQVNGVMQIIGTVMRKDDQFRVSVKAAGGKPHVWHKQDIYVGNRCPTEADDENKDGFIDYEEGSKVWGKMLIPLDADLAQQKAGKNSYPMTDSDGAYTYERRTSFSKLFEDLKAEDDLESEEYMKLSELQGINLEGRVLVIMGTDYWAELPETVAAHPELSQTQSFPVACGLFRKVNMAAELGPNLSQGNTVQPPYGPTTPRPSRPAPELPSVDPTTPTPSPEPDRPVPSEPTEPSEPNEPTEPTEPPRRSEPRDPPIPGSAGDGDAGGSGGGDEEDEEDDDDDDDDPDLSERVRDWWRRVTGN